MTTNKKITMDNIEKVKYPLESWSEDGVAQPGDIFYHQNGKWKVQTKGVNNCYGCVSLRTNAFVTFEQEEVKQAIRSTKD